MRWVWWTLGALAVIVLLVVVIGAVLPQDHVASRTVQLAAAPERVAEVITDVGRYPSWRRGITKVTRPGPPVADGPVRWREHSGGDSLGFEMNDAGSPTQIVTRITDTEIPFGGSWTFDLVPSSGGTSLTITERGSVYNPLFRFVSRFVMGHTKTIDDYMADLVVRLATANRSGDRRTTMIAVDTSAFLYDRAVPLVVRDALRATTDGVEEHAITFASPRGGRATGVLWVPRRTGRLAGVVMQHGLPGRASDVWSDARLIAAAGAVVVSLDAPFVRRGGEVLRFTEADSAEQVQLIVDLQRAVDLLVARPDVDPARLAYVGVSYGGAMGALLAGIERRLRTFILVVGDGGLVAHFTGAEDAEGPLSELSADRRCRWLAAMRPIEPMEFVHRAPPASILFQSGRLDNLVPPADAAALHAAARDPKTVTWYDAGHGLNDAARIARLDWLRTTVGIDAR